MPDYLITTKIQQKLSPSNPVGEDAKRERIVRAKNQATALKHVTSDTITVESLTVDDAMRLAAEGIKIEVAKESE